MMTRTLLLLAVLFAAPAVLPAQSPLERAFREAAETETVKGDLQSAIAQYRKIVESGDRPLAARALVRMAQCYQKLGDQQARAIFERVVREFADQSAPAAAARGALASMASAPAGNAANAPSTRQLWSGPQVDAMGSMSADGRWLSLTDWATGDLAVRDQQSGAVRRLTDTGGWSASGDFAEFSTVAPDGQSVAYAWYVDAKGRYELRLTDAAGRREPKVLLTASDWVRPLAFSRDASQLFAVREITDRVNQLVVISVADGRSTVRKTLDWRYPDGASLSPDGRYLAYDLQGADENPARDIFVLSVAGDAEYRITQGGANDHYPVWSPDGRRLLFISDRTGSEALWSVNTVEGRATSEPVMVKSDLGRNVAALGLASSGTLTYFVNAGGADPHIAALDANGRVTGAPRVVTERYLHANGSASWSPDGAQLAFFSRRGAREARGTAVLVVQTLEDGSYREMTVPFPLTPDRRATPRWFPDGRSILAVERREKERRPRYHRIDLGAGSSEPLFDTTGPGIPQSHPEIAPDGRTVYFVDIEREADQRDQRIGGRQVLKRYDLETRRATVVHPLGAGTYLTSFALSPDGSQIAYVWTHQPTKATGLSVVASSGGDAREVTQPRGRWTSGRYSGLAWTPDQRWLYFVQDADDPDLPDSPRGLQRVAAAGGTPEAVGLAAEVLDSPRMHPKGTHLTFLMGRGYNGEIWALEHFLK